MTGYAPLKLTPTAETPSFITSRLEEQRGLVLLVYVEGAADDMEMLSYFNAVKGQWGADSSFMSFEARKTTELGDTLQQLRVSNPPILAVIRGRRRSRRALHRLDRPQGHGAGRGRRRARPLTRRRALTHARASVSHMRFDRPARRGTIMPTYSVGIQTGDDGTPMRISSRCEYGLRAMVFLAAREDGRPVPLSEIAAGEGIPGAVSRAHPGAPPRERPGQGHARRQRRLPARRSRPATSPSATWSRRSRDRSRWSAACPTTAAASAPSPVLRGSCGAASTAPSAAP